MRGEILLTLVTKDHFYSVVIWLNCGMDISIFPNLILSGESKLMILDIELRIALEWSSQSSYDR